MRVVRDALTTTVTLLVNVPGPAAASAALPAGMRTAGTVVRLRNEDAVELVSAGLARFGGGSTGSGTMGAPRLTVQDVVDSPELRAAYGPRDLPGYWVGAFGGLVTEMSVLDASYTAGSTVINGHRIALDCTDLRVVLPFGWKLQGNATATEAVAPNGTTVKVALQVGSTVVPVTFRGGVRTATCDPGGRLISDPIGGLWTKGTQLYLRIFNASTSGAAYPNTTPSIGPGLAAFANNKWTKGADIVDATTVGASAGGESLWGGCLLGRPLNPSPFVLGAVGDSITNGTGDTGGTGYSWLTRATAGNIPLFRYTKGGVLAAGTVATPFYSMPMLAGCSHVVVMLGSNDLMGSKSFAQITSDLSYLYRAAAAQGPKIVGVTLPPRTDSTDAWATTANQTIVGTDYLGGAGSVRSQVNAWVRAGAGGLLRGYIEFADAVETARDSGVWKAGLASDGIHPNAAGHAAVAAAVDLASIAAL